MTTSYLEIDHVTKFFPAVEAVARGGVIAVYPQIGFSHLVRESGQDNRKDLHASSVPTKPSRVCHADVPKVELR